MNPTLVSFATVALLVSALLWWRRRQKNRPATQGLLRQTHLHYTKHVLDRMQQRGVTKTELLSALHKPDRVIPDPVQNSVKVEKDFEGQTL
jgi:Flp pilus assembly protein TadB